MDEQLIEFVTNWSASNPDFMPNFFGMIDEYRHVATEAGTDLSELPLTNAFLTQVGELFQHLEGK